MKADSIDTIKSAIEALKAKEIIPTQKNTAIESGLSVRTIKRHWDVVKEHRVTAPVDNRVTNSFERFKRRVNHSTMGIVKCAPDMF